MPSFSTSVKNELARVQPGKKCCQLAELSAIVRMDGVFHIQGKGSYALHTLTENAAVARRVLKLTSDLFQIETQVEVERSPLQKANNYIVFIPNQPSLGQFLNELGVLDDAMNIRYDVPPRLVRKACCALAYLRGAFLGGGFVGDPRKEYQLELTTNNAQLAFDLRELMKRFNLTAQLVPRRGSYVVYLREGEQIVRFLALVGAYSSLLKLEDVRVLKELRNRVNRLVNCDTANLGKTVEAALSQLRDITLMEEEVGLGRLPQALQEIAEMRLQAPYANLRDLGEMRDPPLSKSAVNHRMRRLSRLADNLRRKVG
ncbi:MAG: DNA-binding protein WhiA [Actinomycetota bacterium]|nr:DNA-binding protein WhiA [Actinomycetota bacterium]